MCHESTDPPRWNDYGMAIKGAAGGAADFAAALPAALDATADLDSDGDGTSNEEELMLGRAPALSDAPTLVDEGTAAPNPRYAIGRYDFGFAFKRVGILYCGRSPSYDEMQELAALGSDEAAARAKLHDKLDACLESNFWRTVALARLADNRIRPNKAAGADSTITINNKRLVIGDYHYDYRLFRYVLSGDRDMRELLTATYHVQEDEHGTLTQVRGVITKPDQDAIAGGQLVQQQYRAGMLTTQWFLSWFTMFANLPRTTAAQAYRSYLGADIAASEGLRPVEGEPLDIDNKGVAEPRCANCHSTLDPLSYAFAEYEGINVSLERRFGDYMPERTKRIAKWNPSQQKSVLLGKPVANLVEWAKVAAESAEFRRNMANMFLRQALNRGPRPEEAEAFEALCASIPGDGYSANRLIHRLVDLPSFGRP